MSYKANCDRYKSKSYNRCGYSGLKLPPISLGLWHNFGSVDPFERSRDILLHAFDSGITHFDLANNYGPEPGSAETNFGKIINGDLKPYRDEIVVSTKAGYLMWDGPYGEWGSKKYLISSLNQSLKRMKLDYVDIFYSHRPDPDTPMEETMMALDQVVRQGKALYVGLSNYDVEQTVEATTILKELGTPCLIHQPRYNMFHRWVEDGLMDLLHKEGIGAIPFSPLAQGLLTDRYLNEIPSDSRMAREVCLKSSVLNSSVKSSIVSLNSVAQNRGQSLAQMAVAWLLNKRGVTSVLVGASSVEQLSNSIKAQDNTTFTTEEITKIDSILGAVESEYRL